jgi:hypothetical protein
VLLSKKVLIMPTPEEREQAERDRAEREQAERIAKSNPTSPPDTLVLQTLMDVERALGRLETAVEGLERSTAQHTKDLNGLGKAAHTASMFGKIALVVIAPVATAITIAVLHFIYQAFERLLSLPPSAFK